MSILSIQNNDPFVYERQTEYWTSISIQLFFMEQGFDVVAFPITPRTEKYLPADFLFFSGKVKLFGLQYKALYKDAQQGYWNINEDQHQSIRHINANKPWLYYGLSKLTQPAQFRRSLYYTHFLSSDFDYMPRIKNPIVRSVPTPSSTTFGNQKVVAGKSSALFSPTISLEWDAFYQELKDCKAGQKIDSEAHLREFFESSDTILPYYAQRELESALSVFLVDFLSGHVIHYSSFFSALQQG